MALPPTSSIGPLLLGAATLVGGIFVGKIAVDKIQGDSEPGDNAFDDSVRLVASLIGISVTLLQLPQAVTQAKALLQAPPAPAPAPTPAFTPGIPGT
jgi:hypothetical protein